MVSLSNHASSASSASSAVPNYDPRTYFFNTIAVTSPM
jgi:hypothetical protein